MIRKSLLLLALAALAAAPAIFAEKDKLTGGVTKLQIGVKVCTCTLSTMTILPLAVQLSVHGFGAGAGK